MITIKLEKSVGVDTNNETIYESKTYIAPDPKARMVRKAAEMVETLDENNLKTTDLDLLVDYVVELFGNKFTADELWDGIFAKNLVPTIMNCIYEVMGSLNKKLGAIPNGLAE